MMNDQVTKAETNEILEITKTRLEVEGDFVELGCYRGMTSVLLGKAIAQTPKKLWIYDSFAGLPEKSVQDAVGAGSNFRAGELLVTKREVVERIRKAGLKNVIIKKAWFDELEAEDMPERIAFAFCDADLYDSIRVSLKLVVPRLVDGGVVVVHDYNNPQLPGSARAVDEFLRQNPEFRLQVKHTLAILIRK